MTKEQALKDVRNRQRAIAYRVLEEHGSEGITQEMLNEALRLVSLPEIRNDAEMDEVLNGESESPEPEFRMFIAEFLRRGGYTCLKDAMDKLGLDQEGIGALLIHRYAEKDH
jgi:hypothetical protein